MLITGVVSSRIGAKRTLLAGLALIIVFSALAGLVDTIGADRRLPRRLGPRQRAVHRHRAGHHRRRRPAARSAQAIILFEAALGLGIAAGPLVGGQLGSISWRGPFFGVAVLMADRARRAPRSSCRRPRPAGTTTSLARPVPGAALPGPATIAVTALFYNMGFFTLLAFAPFPLDMTALAGRLDLLRLGPAARHHVGVGRAAGCSGASAPCRACSARCVLFAADLAVMAVFTDSKAVLVVGIIVAGAFLGVNNTLITEAVMGAAPVERPVASAAYSFVRFSGGAVAPYAAGKLGENVSVHAPFWMGAGAVLLGVVVLFIGRHTLHAHQHVAGASDEEAEEEAELLAVADLD